MSVTGPVLKEHGQVREDFLEEKRFRLSLKDWKKQHSVSRREGTSISGAGRKKNYNIFKRTVGKLV